MSLLAVFDVPMEKRGKLIGMGGHRIKTIAEETETVVESVDEEKMSIFAPSQEAMEEARERVDAILNEVEPKVRVCHDIVRMCKFYWSKAVLCCVSLCGTIVVYRKGYLQK